MSNSTVPKFTIILSNSYGAGNYAMCGKAYDPRFIVAWPTAKIAVMGGKQAANTLLQIEKSRLVGISAEDEKILLEKITKELDDQTTAVHAAAHLWVDAIIDPFRN